MLRYLPTCLVTAVSWWCMARWLGLVVVARCGVVVVNAVTDQINAPPCLRPATSSLALQEQYQARLVRPMVTRLLELSLALEDPFVAPINASSDAFGVSGGGEAAGEGQGGGRAAAATAATAAAAAAAEPIVEHAPTTTATKTAAYHAAWRRMASPTTAVGRDGPTAPAKRSKAAGTVRPASATQRRQQIPGQPQPSAKQQQQQQRQQQQQQCRGVQAVGAAGVAAAGAAAGADWVQVRAPFKSFTAAPSCLEALAMADAAVHKWRRSIMRLCLQQQRRQQCHGATDASTPLLTHTYYAAANAGDGSASVTTVKGVHHRPEVGPPRTVDWTRVLQFAPADGGHTKPQHARAHAR